MKSQKIFANLVKVKEVKEKLTNNKVSMVLFYFEVKLSCIEIWGASESVFWVSTSLLQLAGKGKQIILIFFVP